MGVPGSQSFQDWVPRFYHAKHMGKLEVFVFVWIIVNQSEKTDTKNLPIGLLFSRIRFLFLLSIKQ